ncbi:hypothetical protein PF005_g21070 [Phytophthora fragariae]|uniref:Secreted protein n=1 Tax=Phytophthora fragariae TaxID=53985 RepID=A0A6A3IUX6_9STRA|nr:hypothetical protein PF003_g19291 [Phytophthora fragariae]KAE8927813.1 hypothetical protein PF009_g22023 [Phytophthora fragariae]KAE8986859.1 hypothetical protein PF011_g19818 [Phytophthora fragariae]KAE9085708.1 hypothetical protein PF007_g21043 [Phytophthora fragariae]KAE9109999.1 hypothetical protein PF010_g11336 [Phytophthora fragariae]
MTACFLVDAALTFIPLAQGSLVSSATPDPVPTLFLLSAIVCATAEQATINTAMISSPSMMNVLLFTDCLQVSPPLSTSSS